MFETIKNIVWAIAFAFVGGTIGIFMICAAASFIPHIINKLTPNIDEEQEIAMGNRAVADYFGRIIHASIIGVSIVIAAVVVVSMFIALY
jgi:hypothetical protein